MTVSDLAGVVYSSGKVFNGLVTGRRDTEAFLRSGLLDGIASRSDLALLEDLRDCAQFIIDRSWQRIDGDVVCAVNATFGRSAALHPGQLRTLDQQIGVSTRYGPHTPEAMTGAGLQQLIDGAFLGSDPCEVALDLFVDLAKAQPFEDGNKRTALFVANAALIGSGTGMLLTVPVDDQNTFNDLLARAYLFNEHDPVKNLLRYQGFTDSLH
ncbi:MULTISPECIES: Fic family protein [Mycolicibacter]|uniref:Fic family protein n=2 Tax=Mycolicibacter TaxID=1073531 RepID=A0ABU5XMZ4_9MYCO|nr:MULTISPECIES: Fic family protein [unclassified Mycolicibacter]MEB3023354.1 Fic family protein [Mycolicibacter sp. MYC098]MEB3033695.1 Fic family protein [Mycolicibacter sp. MYC340]